MTSQHRGKITAWKEDKGFGFITPAEGGKDVFVHISALPDGLRCPPQNADLTYVLGYDSQQRPRAVAVRFDRDPVTMPILPAILASIFFLGLAAEILATHSTALPFVVYAVVSGFTFRAYGADKAIAVRNERLAPGARRERRTPEFTLHMLELLGGWPGALVAQWYYRHKNRKPAYQVAYWLVVVLNLLLLTGYFLVRLLL
ncbi:DUF1294 domain-containing protein [Chloroflexales bacterium ZM16-3]|nr:DUF1294 domain-containing protein [Chloroflexales bacterium ZM16-3]